MIYDFFFGYDYESKDIKDPLSSKVDENRWAPERGIETVPWPCQIPTAYGAWDDPFIGLRQRSMVTIVSGVSRTLRICWAGFICDGNWGHFTLTLTYLQVVHLIED